MSKEKKVIKEKERYEITDAHFLSNSAIFDTETNEILILYQICDLLNQQGNRIKELEQENQQLKQQLAESKKPKEIRFNGFVVDCNYDEARKVLQENLFKMQAENKKLKESEELSNYAKCISQNKKLEEDFEHLHEEFVEKCNEFELKEHAYKQTIFELNELINKIKK